jgi:hypothetical protein
MKKLLFSIAGLLLGTSVLATTPPDEGMWLPMFIKDYNYADMQKIGLKLTPEQMYDINHSSLKDAIVQLGNFCTAEVISKDGLLLTNHHCGYAAITDHTTEQNDYLKYGFWAMNKDEELPNEGLTVTFLVRMDDVTSVVLKDIPFDMKKSDRNEKIEKTVKNLIKEHSDNGRYKVEVKSFYEGNEYYMFIYETFKDVRLVGAPPSSIGKFGGDTDNWMWPRHTGDFCLFRVYTAPDGSPAEYSKNNIPLTPKHHLPVSLKGIEEGDFAMIWGYPGSTERFMTSYEVNNQVNIMNPPIIELFDALLPVMQSAMFASDKARIGYADHFAVLANSWKNTKGETASLKALKVEEKKAKDEKKLTAWINDNPARIEKYGHALSNIQKTCAELDGTSVRSFIYSNYSLHTIKTLMSPLHLQSVKPQNKEKKYDNDRINAFLAQYQKLMEGTDSETEAKMIEASLFLWKNLPEDKRPDIFTYISKNYKGDYKAFAEAAVYKSIFGTEENFKNFLAKPSLKKYETDPLVNYVNAIIKIAIMSQGVYMSHSSKLETPRRQYIAAVKKMTEKPLYPDANFTMRMTYGQVLDYYPADGVHYLHRTTEQGILEKEQPNDPEFDVPAKLKELIIHKDFGQYGVNGVLPVCFLTNNDITGGNSGSPVLNNQGELIGVAFDGNWEALSSDIVFNTDLQRCINVDIRYVLFVIDKYAGAGYLLNEMTIMR